RVRFDPLLEVCALDELVDDVTDTVGFWGFRTEIVGGDDSLVLEPCRVAGLVEEFLLGPFRREEPGTGHLDRHLAVHHLIMSQIHVTIRASTKFAADFVATDPLRKRRRWIARWSVLDDF